MTTHSNKNDVVTEFQCPNCNEEYSLNVAAWQLKDKKLKCKKCQEIFVFQEKVNKDHSDDRGEKVEKIDRRKFQRKSIGQRAMFINSSYHQFFGTVSDISKTSVKFHFCGCTKEENMILGERVILQIALTEVLPLQSYAITYICHISRIDNNAVILAIKDQVTEKEMGGKFFTKSKVVIKRSNGSAEYGWEIIPCYEGMPASIQEAVSGLNHSGPAAVCILRHPSQPPAYKLTTLVDVIRTQSEHLDILLQELRGKEDSTLMEDYKLSATEKEKGKRG